MRKFFLFLFSSLFTIASYAQCAMCRATVENNVADGSDTIGSDLNTGILYLMLVPYIALGTLAYLWYTNSKKNKLKRERIEQALSKSL